ncbi:MAG TPA: hypothetical protein VFF73_37445 [Planctomycetota bacterium]|nr:hypothetical protein [Planctomycetota bacterium]
MSAKLHYMILCDAVVFSQGKFTYYGVFDRIQATRFPCVHGTLSIAVQLSCDPGPHVLSLRAVDSGGTDVIPTLPPVTIETNHPLGMTTTSITLQGLPLQRPGIYSFQLYLDEKLLGARDFFVEKIAAAPGQPGAEQQQTPPPGDPNA